MKSFIALSIVCFNSISALGPMEIREYARNQKLVNECYYHATEDHEAEWFFRGKIDAYEEIMQLIDRHTQGFEQS
jgi:hypothetical protein